ncbi:MAG TPA: restriction endonuclease subunit S [Candidatus Wunengus sp. YC60]|uniref:restriction endonuclease subunit S n=1 Tax=Candidatus Wunengus sp. YC60 TaxID=3367697 RepID=UPI00402A5407
MSKSGSGSEIPATWQSICLSDVFYDPKNEIVSGPFGSNLKTSDYANDGVPILRIQNIQRNALVFKNIKHISQYKADQLSRHSYKKGDIVITKLGDPVGKACIIPDNMDDGIIIADLVRARLNHSLVSKKFIVYQLNSEHVIQQFKAKTRGTTRPRVSLNQVRELNIVLAPLKEQHRIVIKIEELFSELDYTEEGLKTSLKQIDVYRQSLLKSAFDVKNNGGKLGKLEKIGTISTGGTPSKKNLAFYGTKYNFYKPGDLGTGENITDSNDKLSYLGFKNARIAPKNSILVTCIGATLGKTGLIREAGAFNQQINAIIPNRDFLPKYVYYQILSPEFQMQLKQNASSTTIPIINKSKFSKLNFIFLSIEKQKRIVQELEAKFSVIDNLESVITANLQKIASFRNVILTKAFAGRLVPQDREDEDANKLLQRIQIEKEDYLNSKKGFQKKVRMEVVFMEKDKTIIEILKEADSPIEAETLWLQSKHRADIDAFYAELKKIEIELKVETKGRKTLIGLKK